MILESRARKSSDAFLPASFSLLLASGSFPRMIKLAVLDLKWESEPEGEGMDGVRERKRERGEGDILLKDKYRTCAM